MLKENISVFRKIMMCADLCLAAMAFFLAHYLRSLLPDFAALNHFLYLLPLFLGIWAVLLHYFGMYESLRTLRIPQIFFEMLKITAVGFLVFNTTIYIFKTPHLSRIFETFIFGLSALFISIARVISIFFFRKVREKGYNYRNILIVGTGKRAQHFIELINQHNEWGFRITGLLDDDPAKTAEVICGYPVMGTLEDLARITNQNVIDEVVFIVPRSWLSKIEPLIYFSEAKGLRIHLAVDYFELKLSKVKTTELNGFPMLTFETTPDRLWHLLFKRLVDIIVSAAALVLCAPLFFCIALLIKMTSPGPVFFRQNRCGLNGRNFTLYKFRTMHLDAENRLKDLLAHNEMRWPVFKMKNDPRLAPIGRFLRKTSLDELPQLWNVLKGNMSIVGPRPPIPREVSVYENWQRRRLSMRPGITCLWQVNGRNNISDFDKWVKLDLDYIDHWSLWLDCKIMLKTIPAVLAGIGAK